MPRRREQQAQLELEWTDSMRWEDVPDDAREQLREHLVAVLREAAQRGGRVVEPTDE